MSLLLSILSTPSHPILMTRLDWETNLERFQSDELDSDVEWHQLVSTEAREALGKKEVQRQSVIFEVIKSEKEYVRDLLVIREVSFHMSSATTLSL
jgi:RHO1 GDP-GTP exchange protein 1/2